MTPRLPRCRVAVLCGGLSPERSISLESGRNVAAALRDRGVNVKIVDVTTSFLDAPPPLDCDVAFIALHGGEGEDGTVQTVLERMGIPYTGSPPEASRIGLDKAASRRRFERAGLFVAPAVLVEDTPAFPPLDCPLPAVVKPVTGGSTIGVSVVRDPAALLDAIRKALRTDRAALVERFVEGREFTVAVFEEMVFPPLLIEPAAEIFDFDCKYSDGGARFSFDHGLPPERLAALEKAAKDAYNAIGCRGLARVDFILPPEGPPCVLEINTVPGMTSHSLAPLAAARAGIPFDELCMMAVRAALERKAPLRNVS